MTQSSLLRTALRDGSVPGLRLLPVTAADLLEQVQAPPRLAAHLRLVHDVACQIAEWADGRYRQDRPCRRAVRTGLGA